MNKESNKSQDGRLNLEKLFSKARENIASAERHLGVPPGTISSLDQDGDYTAVLKCTTTIEPILNDAIESEIKSLRKQKAEHDGANALARFVTRERSTDKKAKLAYELGIIDEKRYLFVKSIFSVRHFYAHHISNLHLSIWEIVEKMDCDKEKMFQSLTFFKASYNHPPDLKNGLIRLSMSVLLSDFLASALQAMTPPRGLLDFIMEQQAMEDSGNDQ